MPIYVYQEILENGEPGDIFEVEQAMSEPVLEVHPLSGLRVKKLFQPPNLGVKYSEGAQKKKLDNRSVEKAGFTKYERDKLTGTYHKVAGKDRQAPKQIKP